MSQREGDLIILQRSWVSAQPALAGHSSVLMLTFSSGLAMLVRDHALEGTENGWTRGLTPGSEH